MEVWAAVRCENLQVEEEVQVSGSLQAGIGGACGWRNWLQLFTRVCRWKL